MYYVRCVESMKAAATTYRSYVFLEHAWSCDRCFDEILDLSLARKATQSWRKSPFHMAGGAFRHLYAESIEANRWSGCVGRRRA